ncbi:MAG: DUF4019 domain-containing protein [Pseudomonadales bacterium]
MSKRSQMAVTLLIVLSSSATVLAGEREEAAEVAALAWLSDVDAGQYERSWGNAARLFKQQIDAAQWAHAVGGARLPLGMVISRKILSATYAQSLPGAPDGDYVVIQFQTEFEHKTSAVETVTPMLDADVWRVSGYYVR